MAETTESTMVIVEETTRIWHCVSSGFSSKPTVRELYSAWPTLARNSYKSPPEGSSPPLFRRTALILPYLCSPFSLLYIGRWGCRLYSGNLLRLKTCRLILRWYLVKNLRHLTAPPAESDFVTHAASENPMLPYVPRCTCAEAHAPPASFAVVTQGGALLQQAYLL